MAPRISFVMVLHNHQPVGNFDFVLEEGYNRCYLPFLQALGRCESLPVSLHYSGPLLEWLESHRPEFFELLRAQLKNGNTELIGGAFYEPILTMLPRRDAAGQIRMNARYLEDNFGVSPRGMWLAERVWEQQLTSVLADAGVEYLTLDDTHFRFAGMDDAQLDGPYLTEDEGRTLRVFPAAEKLRYLIPYAKVSAVIGYLREVAEAAEKTGRSAPCLVYADDGEKFGLWPNTYEHVYEDGWLRDFFAALPEESDWLEVKTLARAADEHDVRGLAYLPDASYREMTEWALPAGSLLEYESAVKKTADTPGAKVLRRFARGASWRNFKVKYPEARRLYAKMIAVSEKLAHLEAQRSQRSGSEPGTPSPELSAARRELYRGQCNCAYWHGVFGGLYLPHLRSAVWRHLLAAESLIENQTHGGGPWVQAERADLDLDGRQDIRLASDRLAATISPATGAHLTELVVREKRFNLLDTLTRRYEAYHEKLLAGATTTEADEVASIHDLALAKEEHLDQHLRYDAYERQSLIDHLFTGNKPITAQELARLERRGEDSWLTGRYDRAAVKEADGSIGCRCTRDGSLDGAQLRVTKEITLAAGEERLQVIYRLRADPQAAPLRLGVEWNFGLLAGRAPDRFYYSSAQANGGNLSTIARRENLDFIGLRDEWLGLDVRLTFSRPADVYTYPVETVSQSEAGFERVYQSSVVLPLWPLFAQGEREEMIAMTFEVRHDV